MKIKKILVSQPQPESAKSPYFDLAEKMGITTWGDRSRFGLSLALGAGAVKMIDIAEAYSIFANLGEKVEINPILEVDNYLGEKVYQKTVESEVVAESKDTFLMIFFVSVIIITGVVPL